MRVQVLGGLRVISHDDDVELGSPKQRMVLAVLALAAPRVVSTDRLLDLLWTDHDPDKATVGLQSYVSNLRRVLDPDRSREARSSVVVREFAGYRLDAAVDLAELESAVDAAVELAAGGDAAGASGAARQALIGATAPPLPELADLPVVLEAGARWRRSLARALELVATHELEVGRAADVASLIEPLLGEVRDHERLHVLAATAAYRSGRQSDALRIIDRLRRTLREDAGLEPSPEVRDLEQAILAHTATVAGPDPTPNRTAPAPAPTLERDAPLLVGRTDEQAALVGAVSAAAAGLGGVALVVADAGVGKSTLLDALLAGVPPATHTATVTCPSTAATPPFWPLTRLTDLGFGADATHGGDPFLVAEAIAAAVADRPTVLVIDDLQWADADTLRTVTHLGAALRSSRGLLVLACRPLGPDAGAELVSCVAEVTRHGRLQIELRALAPEAIGAWLARRITAPSADLAPIVHERTGGNALFARELIELIASDPDALDALRSRDPERVRRSVPAGVRAVVRQRVGRLPGDTQHLLAIASALGTEVRLDALAQVTDASPEDCARILAPAAADGLATVALDSVTFSHALVQDALAGEMTPDRVAEVNARFARALAAADAGDEHAALIAHHAAAGALAGTGELAATAAGRAAQLAMDRGAHRDALRFWNLAAAHLDAPNRAPARRDALLHAAGAAIEADDVDTATHLVTELLTAAFDADDLGTGIAAADVLNHPSIFPNHPYGAVDAELVGLLRATLERVDPADAASRAVLGGAIAIELADSPDTTGRQEISAEAVRAARACGDPRILARTLHARSFALKHQGGVEERLAITEEVRRLAATTDLGDELTLLADLQAALAEFALGRFDDLDDRLARCLVLADRPMGEAARSQLTYFRSHLAFVRGRYAEAEVLGADAHRRTLISRPREAPGIRVAQQLMVAHDLGGVEDDLLSTVAAIPGTNGYSRPLRTYAALVLLDAGRRSDAEAIAPPTDGLPSRPDDYLTLFVDATTAALAVELGDRDLAAASIDRLAPWRGRWVYAGTAAGSFGLVEHTLARCEALAGDTDAAAVDFAAAVDGHRRLGAPAWLARSRRLQDAFLDARP